MVRRPALAWIWTAALIALGQSECSFPEHDFIPAGEFEKLKNDSGLGGSGAAGGVGGSGASGGIGGSGALGGNGGSGAAGGAGGAGGSTGGTGGDAGPDGSAASGGSAGASGSAGLGGAGGAGGAGGSGGTGGAGGGTGGTGGTGGSTGGTGGTGGAGGSGGTGGGCGDVVINELSTGTSASAGDEFVELYNAGSCSVSLTGFTLKYSSASGSNPATRWTGTATDSLAAGGYFVIGGGSFTGVKQGTLTSGLAAPGGGIGLHDPSNSLIDAVSYQLLSTTTHPYTEGTPAANIPEDKSAARIPDGSDTDVNSVDFDVPAARTPGAANTL